MTTAKRNAAIKKLLEAHYGVGKVWVRGSRGTAYGWVSVYIDTPVSDERGAFSEEYAKANKIVMDAFREEIGTYGYDDPGSDYGYGSKINFSFRVPYDVIVKREKEAAK
jgi:hypothetical protein